MGVSDTPFCDIIMRMLRMCCHLYWCHSYCLLSIDHDIVLGVEDLNIASVKSHISVVSSHRSHFLDLHTQLLSSQVMELMILLQYTYKYIIVDSGFSKSCNLPIGTTKS